MDDALRARIQARAERARFQSALAGAYGWCTDEGDEHRDTIFEYSRLDALTIARSGFLGEYAKAHANSKDIRKQRDVADFLAAPSSARKAGVVVRVDVSERQLGKAEFFARQAAGVDVMLQNENFATTRAAELEWMMREAEIETGFSRDDANAARRQKVIRRYRNFCNRDR